MLLVPHKFLSIWIFTSSSLCDINKYDLLLRFRESPETNPIQNNWRKNEIFNRHQLLWIFIEFHLLDLLECAWVPNYAKKIYFFFINWVCGCDVISLIQYYLFRNKKKAIWYWLQAAWSESSFTLINVSDAGCIFRYLFLFFYLFFVILQFCLMRYRLLYTAHNNE